MAAELAAKEEGEIIGKAVFLLEIKNNKIVYI
jgi:hypothetical protein